MERLRGQFIPCRWCGSRKLTAMAGRGKKGWKAYCPNPECPRKGVVPWVVPFFPLRQVLRGRRPDGEPWDMGPSFDNLIRCIEDSLERAG